MRRNKDSRPLYSLSKGLVILYEDGDILVVNKPSGLLTVGTDREKSRTAYFILTDYVRKGRPKSRDRVFIVHRLDRDASGILVFAKSEKAKHGLQGRWNETVKKYLAVVHGKCKKSSDTITTYLAENKAQVVYSTTDAAKGKLSHTAYKVLRQTKNFALLEIDLITGRKNQIRVHLADIGHPIAGDRKYGIPGGSHTHQRASKKGSPSFIDHASKSPAKTGTVPLALHARSISFNHPISGQPLTFAAPVPGYFTKLVGRIEG